MNDGQAQLVTITIDGVRLEVPKGTLLVEAAKTIRREIPVYCYHTKMGPAGLCRICLVEIEGMPKLQIACNTAASDGMVVRTQSEKAADGRRSVLEFYLKNHPLDCPICDKGGECDLQDYAMAYGQDYSRSADPKVSKPKAIDLGPTIVLDEERCVVCQRCVRFDDIIVGERELVLKDRGVRNIIATATGEPYRHNYTGNVTELCPVGALTSKTYRFKSRPWDLRRTTTTCTQCSVGCQMHVDVRRGLVQRTMSVAEDDAISDGWLCDRGRYNVGFLDHDARLTQPLYKLDGEWTQIAWDDALELWAAAIREADPASVAAIGGGRLTNEEAFLLQHVMRAKGVRHLDWRAGKQTVATPGGHAKIADLERMSAIVLVGESPAERAPILDLRIRKAAFQKRARLICIAPNERRYPPPIGAVEARTVADAIEALPEKAERIAVVWDGADPAALQTLLDALPSSAAISTYVTGEQPNARGAEAMGMLPEGDGFATPEIFGAAREGKIAVLSLLGVNPMLQYPDGALVREALERTPFVVVSDLFLTQTAQLATLVLPARAAFEKDGTTTNLAGDVLPLNAVRSLESPDGALTDLEMLAGLAAKLGVDIPAAEGIERAVAAKKAREVAIPWRAFVSAASPVHAQTRIFAGGGTSAHDAGIAGLRPLPELAISAEDAAAMNLSTGDYVDVTSEAGTMHDLLVEVRAGLPRGSFCTIGGLPDSPANVLGGTVEISNIRRSAT